MLKAMLCRVGDVQFFIDCVSNLSPGYLGRECVCVMSCVSYKKLDVALRASFRGLQGALLKRVFHSSYIGCVTSCFTLKNILNSVTNIRCGEASFSTPRQ